MRRREFITLVGGGAAVGALSARAQQPAMPVIGVLDARSSGTFEGLLGALRQGLKDNGYVEGVNVAIELRWAEGQFNRLPALAAELVRRWWSWSSTPRPPGCWARHTAVAARHSG
jgi:putative ABC transport system substrate-binding protein